jgi:copper chaperone NosL
MTRWLVVAVAAASACAAGPPPPATLALGEDACAHCRMTLVSRTTAAQIARPGDEPVFFDEIACLRDYLVNQVVPGDAVVYVADHRTGEWVNARAAVFTATSAPTPMASGLLAHADTASRDRDPAAAGGRATATGAILGLEQGKTP